MSTPANATPAGTELSTPFERMLYALFAGGIIASSRLALANVLLGLALVGTVAEALRARGTTLRRSALDAPVLAFVLGSVLSAFLSVEPATSLLGLKSLLTFLVVPMVAIRVRSRRTGEVIVDGLALAGSALALHGLVQFAGGMDSLDRRIRGPLSHYMTFAGVLLVVLLVSVARVALGPGSRRARLLLGGVILLGAGLAALSVSPDVPAVARWPLRAGVGAAFLAAALAALRRGRGLRRSVLLSLAASLMSAAIVLSYTRNAWIGGVVGVVVILAASAPRAILLFAPAAVAVGLVLPRPVLDRIAGTFSIRETSNYDRLCMIEAGVAMIEDRPLSGMGLDAVKLRYPLYRRADAPRFRVPHLHNNMLQIAAERGLFTLGAYLAILGVFFWRVGGALRRAASREDKRFLVGPLAAVAGITVAGLFEANFLDTEVLLPTLFLLALPFADGSVPAEPDDEPEAAESVAEGVPA